LLLQVIEGSYKPYIQILSENIAMNNGYFTFRADDPSSPSGEKIIPARFTFLYRKTADGNWEIVNHHNSVMPTAPEALKPGYAYKGPKFNLTKAQEKVIKSEIAATTQLWIDTVTSGTWLRMFLSPK